jgi:hypothetical protein
VSHYEVVVQPAIRAHGALQVDGHARREAPERRLAEGFFDGHHLKRPFIDGDDGLAGAVHGHALIHSQRVCERSAHRQPAAAAEGLDGEEFAYFFDYSSKHDNPDSATVALSVAAGALFHPGSPGRLFIYSASLRSAPQHSLRRTQVRLNRAMSRALICEIYGLKSLLSIFSTGY